MAILKIRLKAFTLVEVLVATSIITIIFIIVVTASSNVMSTTNEFLSLKAAELINEVASRSQQQGIWQAEQIETEQLLLDKTVIAYPGYSDLLLIHYKVMSKQGRLIKEEKQIRYANED